MDAGAGDKLAAATRLPRPRRVGYYHRSRPHLGLDKDAPEPRPVQGAEAGEIVAFPQVGGLHHRYERRAA